MDKAHGILNYQGDEMNEATVKGLVFAAMEQQGFNVNRLEMFAPCGSCGWFIRAYPGRGTGYIIFRF